MQIDELSYLPSVLFPDSAIFRKEVECERCLGVSLVYDLAIEPIGYYYCHDTREEFRMLLSTLM